MKGGGGGGGVGEGERESQEFRITYITLQLITNLIMIKKQ